MCSLLIRSFISFWLLNVKFGKIGISLNFLNLRDNYKEKALVRINIVLAYLLFDGKW